MIILSNKLKDFKNIVYNKKLFNKILLFFGLDCLVMLKNFSYIVI